MNQRENLNKYMEKNDIKSENNDEEEVEQNKSENENIYEEQEINPKKEKENMEEKDERIIENKQEKISIIPEDNDIFCTKNYDNKIQKKPRKIQENSILNEEDLKNSKISKKKMINTNKEVSPHQSLNNELNGDLIERCLNQYDDELYNLKGIEEFLLNQKKILNSKKKKWKNR